MSTFGRATTARKGRVAALFRTTMSRRNSTLGIPLRRTSTVKEPCPPQVRSCNQGNRDLQRLCGYLSAPGHPNGTQAAWLESDWRVPARSALLPTCHAGQTKDLTCAAHISATKRSVGINEVDGRSCVHNDLYPLRKPLEPEIQHVVPDPRNARRHITFIRVIEANQADNLRRSAFEQVIQIRTQDRGQFCLNSCSMAIPDSSYSLEMPCERRRIGKTSHWNTESEVTSCGQHSVLLDPAEELDPQRWKHILCQILRQRFSSGRTVARLLNLNACTAVGFSFLADDVSHKLLVQALSMSYNKRLANCKEVCDGFLDLSGHDRVAT
ncbi:hypothetical protein KC356_g192 [Hortaea werneckii]|nr:hypothetical protein KC356_g192 [Hortaea werneckii]